MASKNPRSTAFDMAECKVRVRGMSCKNENETQAYACLWGLPKW